MVAGRGRDDASGLLLGRESGELRQDATRLEGARLLEELGLEEGTSAEMGTQCLGGEKRRPVELARDDTGRGFYINVYSGPSPPSGGVKRPPFAVMAPHWTQFDGVTPTSTTFPPGLAGAPTS